MSDLNPYEYTSGLNYEVDEGGDIFGVSEREVINHIVYEFLSDKKKLSTEFLAYVREIVPWTTRAKTANVEPPNPLAKWISNTDPFHNAHDDYERLTNAGKIKNPKEKIVAYVELPSVFARVGRGTNTGGSWAISNSTFSLLRIDITNVEKEHGREPQKNEVIYVKFKDESLRQADFLKYPKRKPVILKSNIEKNNK